MIRHKSIVALVRVALAVLVLTPPGAVRAADRQKPVLVLYATQPHDLPNATGVIAALDLAGTLTTPSAWSRNRLYIASTLAVLMAQTTLIAALLVQRKRRRQAEARAQRTQAELRASYERIRDLGVRLVHAQEPERSRIARELHDDLGQQVAVLTIDLQLLSAAGPARENLVNSAQTRAQCVARSLHDLSHRIHPATLRLIGLLPALEALEREWSESEMAICITHENVPPVLPHHLTLSLFRVVQEALQNALKHSRAHAVSVHLRGESDALLALTIADDGVGFDVKAVRGDGLGLLSMSERLEAMGGNLYIDARPGLGTRLEIRVPLPVADRIRAAV